MPVSIYQIKVTLLGADPPIWRCVETPSATTLRDLHDILQIAMGWTNSHLHQFRVGNVRYSDPEFELDDVEDEFQTTVADVAPQVGRRFSYEYDFGDGWEHEIVVENIIPQEKRIRFPRCIAGERACPPDDCGGIWGYGNFLEAIGDPTHEEHDDLLEWFGGSFDSEAFDLDEVNEALRDIRTAPRTRG